MAASPPYNTALGHDALDALRAGLTGISYCASAKGVVFVHDMLDPLGTGKMSIVAKAECIYSEMPWPAGWKVFHERAAAPEQGRWRDYIEAVARMVDDLKKPTYLVCSKYAAQRLAGDQGTASRITLNGGGALLVTRYAAPIGATDSGVLAQILAERYRSAWDFSCGFGRTLRHFGYKIGSDIDRKCLDHIAREYL